MNDHSAGEADAVFGDDRASTSHLITICCSTLSMSMTRLDHVGPNLFLPRYWGVYQKTVRLLFEASSLIHYWRWGRGHVSGDPFQLDIPIERLQGKCDAARILQAAMVEDQNHLVPDV